MQIRQLTASDAESYWNLRLKALKSDPDSFLTTYEEALQKQNPIEQYAKDFLTENIYTFGAFENGVIIGMVTLIRENHQKLRHRANIVAMYVDTEKRGRGIAKNLLEEAIKIAKGINELEQLYLTVDSENTPAKKLYTKLGFNLYAYEEKAIKFEGKYRDEEHMVLFLS